MRAHARASDVRATRAPTREYTAAHKSARIPAKAREAAGGASYACFDLSIREKYWSFAPPPNSAGTFPLLMSSQNALSSGGALSSCIASAHGQSRIGRSRRRNQQSEAELVGMQLRRAAHRAAEGAVVN